MKYEEIERLSVKQIDSIRCEHGKPSMQGVTEILNFYKPQIQKLIDNYNQKSSTDLKITEFKVNNSSFNTAAHVLNIVIQLPGWFSFHLSELHNNCGILVSTNTIVNHRQLGFGTLLHAIKEDIAYYNTYSYLMYSDVCSPYHANTKLLNRIPGIKQVFDGYNTRSSNKIGIWIKDINEWYENKQKDLKQETTEIITLIDL